MFKYYVGIDIIRLLVPRRCMYICIDVCILCVYAYIKYEYTKRTKKKNALYNFRILISNIIITYITRFVIFSIGH